MTLPFDVIYTCSIFYVSVHNNFSEVIIFVNQFRFIDVGKTFIYIYYLFYQSFPATVGDVMIKTRSRSLFVICHFCVELKSCVFLHSNDIMFLCFILIYI